MNAVVAAFNQEKALVGAFSVIANLRMDLFEALVSTQPGLQTGDNQSNAIIVKHISPAFPVVEVMTARLPAVICVT